MDAVFTLHTKPFEFRPNGGFATEGALVDSFAQAIEAARPHFERVVVYTDGKGSALLKGAGIEAEYFALPPKLDEYPPQLWAIAKLWVYVNHGVGKKEKADDKAPKKDKPQKDNSAKEEPEDVAFAHIDGDVIELSEFDTEAVGDWMTLFEENGSADFYGALIDQARQHLGYLPGCLHDWIKARKPRERYGYNFGIMATNRPEIVRQCFGECFEWIEQVREHVPKLGDHAIVLFEQLFPVAWAQANAASINQFSYHPERDRRAVHLMAKHKLRRDFRMKIRRNKTKTPNPPPKNAH